MGRVILTATWKDHDQQIRKVARVLKNSDNITQAHTCKSNVGPGQKLNLQGGWTYIHAFHSTGPEIITSHGLGEIG